jgi:hypothetical protein
MKIYPMQALRNLFHFCIVCALLMACKTLPISSLAKGRIEGRVLLEQFNQQGVINQTKSQPVSRWVYLFEPSTLKDLVNAKDNNCEDILSKKLDSVLSSKKGDYSFSVAEGKYSIFIKEGKGYYIPYFSGINGVAHVFIDAHKPLSLDIILHSEATY